MKTIRNRYILFEIISDEEIGYEEFRKSFLNVCFSLLGELDYKNANILILENEFKGRKGIIKCSHKYVDPVKLGLGLLREINGKKVIVQSLKVSGTLKSLKR